MSEQNNSCNCGCSNENTAPLTPAVTDNFPGLYALKYRVGKHSSFKAAMLEAISQYPELNSLTARTDDDMGIATLDAWATVLDVLSFYQERIINEGFLRTATERLSVLELAKHISYKLRPGVAASTLLAFSMNEAQGAPATAIIPVGTKVQSVPDQGQLPQIFETIEEIQAKVEWNNIPILTRKKIASVRGDKEIFLQGIGTGLQIGDGLLIIGDERAADPKNENWDFRKVKAIFPDKDNDFTKVTFHKPLGTVINGIPINPAAKGVKAYALRQKAALFGNNAPEFKTLSGSIKNDFLQNGLVAEYYNGINFDHFAMSRIDDQINFDWGTGSPDAAISANNFSVRWTGWILAPAAGSITFYTDSDDGVRLWVNDTKLIDNWTPHGSTENQKTTWLNAGQLYRIKLEYFEQTQNALIKLSWSWPGRDKHVIPAANFNTSSPAEWPGLSIRAISKTEDTIFLDNIYSKIVKDGWVVLSNGDYEEVYGIEDAGDSSRKGFTLVSKSTKLKLSGENLKEQFDTRVRDTAVYAQSEELAIAEMPVNTGIVDYQLITLARLMQGFKAGQNIIVTGKRVRVEITAAANTAHFEADTNAVATRNLKAGDSLIVLEKPAPASGGMQKWRLQDSAGNNGTATISTTGIKIQPAHKNDGEVSEAHVIKEVVAQADPTCLVLNEQLDNYFDNTTVYIKANVAASTHGETKQEIIGSGNSALTFQKFDLKQKPLTFVSAANASGAATTLSVRVNDILWNEALTFYNTDAKDKVYTASIADDGTVTVAFGDGNTGSRLPTGAGNITAKYRVGIGSSGLLKAGQLSMLLTPQLGVNKVINPLPSTGAADPEVLEDAKKNAPFTVLTLDRIVSIKDFENFTRSFAGIGKARAELIWNGQQQMVHISIAGADKGAVNETSDLFKNLTLAIQSSVHTQSPVKIDSYELVTFSLTAGVAIDPRYIFDKVKDNILATLQTTFSFEARSFGQDVTLAEIMTTIQQVEGVVYVDVNALNGKDPFSTGGQQRITANIARWHTDAALPAQLLIIKEVTINQILQ